MQDLILLDPGALAITEQDVLRLFGEYEKSASTRHRRDFATFSARINLGGDDLSVTALVFRHLRGTPT